jgi:AraC-like DNA-binding protein
LTPGSKSTAGEAGPTVAAGLVRAWVDLAAARGASRTELLERSGLNPDALRDLDHRIPLARLEALIGATKEVCNQPAIGLHFGESVDCAEYSIVSMISRACATVADALVQRNRYGRLLAEFECAGPDRFVLEPAGGNVWLIDTRTNPNALPELTESFFARVASASRRPDGTSFLKAARFTHPEPSYRAEYDRIFRVPLEFGSRRNALLMDGAWPRQEIALEPTYVFGIMSAHAETLLQRLDEEKTLRGRVERLLVPILHTGDASIGRIAGALGFSRQTLFRKLRAEGATYQRVLDELRHTLAIEYLQGGRVSVNEVAYLVGFSDAAAFSRAFRRWTGTSPGSIRNAAEVGATRSAEPAGR